MIPILLYHDITPDHEYYTDLPPLIFEAQMKKLKSLDIKIISLEQAFALKNANQPMKETCVVLTFDDSYFGLYKYAFPILKELGFNFTVFVITDWIGKKNIWNHRAHYFSKHLNESELTILFQYGAEIGSHSCSHQNLLKYSENELIDDLSNSIERIKSITGKAPISFSYPYGKLNDKTVSIVKLNFSLAVTTCYGGNNWDLHLYKLNRIYVKGDSDFHPEQFLK